MAVVVEAYTVLIRIEAIKSSLAGGVSRFLQLVPNQTLCSDGVLCRVAFMALEDAIFFSNQLFAEGITPATDEAIESSDIALALHTGKMICPCTWIQLDQFEIGAPEKLVWGATVKGWEELPLAFPEGWSYEMHQSLSFIEASGAKDVTAPNSTTREMVDKDGNVLYAGRPYFSTDGLPN